VLLEAPAPRAGTLGGHSLSGALEIVGERLEIGRITEPAGERPSDQPVREPRVTGEEWAVQIRPERVADAGSFDAVLAVVPEARDNASKRLCALVEIRPAGVVLEAGERSALPGVELAFEQDVADHATLAGDGVMGKEADAGKLGARAVPIETS
jgi:hypothetical protein